MAWREAGSLRQTLFGLLGGAVGRGSVECPAPGVNQPQVARGGSSGLRGGRLRMRVWGGLCARLPAPTEQRLDSGKCGSARVPPHLSQRPPGRSQIHASARQRSGRPSACVPKQPCPPLHALGRWPLRRCRRDATLPCAGFFQRWNALKPARTHRTPSRARGIFPQARYLSTVRDRGKRRGPAAPAPPAMRRA